MARVKVKGIRKGKRCVFNDKIRPFTARIRPGEAATVRDNTHDYFVVVGLDDGSEMTVPRHALSPLGPLEKIVEAVDEQ